jgi:hypothetical protein
MLADEDLMDKSAGLIRPVTIAVDQGLSDDRARHMVRIAQLLYTFWNTGEERFLAQAVDTSFVDKTLPPGRPQGLAGPVAASGQDIGFTAFDIQHVGSDKIVEDWHLEDEPVLDSAV